MSGKLVEFLLVYTCLSLVLSDSLMTYRILVDRYFPSNSEVKRKEKVLLAFEVERSREAIRS